MALTHAPVGNVVRILRYRSRRAGDGRSAWVYAPAAAGGRRAAVPIVYLLHGDGDGSVEWASIDAASGVLQDDGAGLGAAAILVIPIARAVASSRPSTGGRVSDGYANDVFLHLMPAVERTFGVPVDRRRRVVLTVAGPPDPRSDPLFLAVKRCNAALPPERQFRLMRTRARGGRGVTRTLARLLPVLAPAAAR